MRMETTTSTESRFAARRTAVSTSGWSARPGAPPSARAGSTTKGGRRSIRRSSVQRSTTTSTWSGVRDPPNPDDGLHGLRGLLAGPRGDDDRAGKRSVADLRGGRGGRRRHKTALMPAGPLGTRHVGLYCPPYAIPSLSQSKAAAWELAKFLCAPEQVLEMRRAAASSRSRGTPCSTIPALAGAVSAPELVETTVASRAFARGERPVTRFGMEVGNVVGDEIVRVLTGELTARQAMQIAEERVGALGEPRLEVALDRLSGARSPASCRRRTTPGPAPSGIPIGSPDGAMTSKLK